MSLKNYALFSFCFVSLAALLVGCGTDGGGSSPLVEYDQIMSAEEILSSTGGDWDIVEFEQPPDTASLHKLARKAVNPRDAVHSGKYVRKYDPRDEDIHYRILQVQLAASGARPSNSYAGKVNEDFGVASSLWPYPDHKPGEKRVKTTQVASLSGSAEREVVQSIKSKPVRVAVLHADIKPELLMSEVSGIRFGTHPGKTRMVLDVTELTKFTHIMVNGDKAVEIRLDGAAWNAGQKLKILNHPFIIGYGVKTNKEHTVLTIKLKEAARVKWATSLPPNASKGNRLVFDIVQADS